MKIKSTLISLLIGAGMILPGIIPAEADNTEFVRDDYGLLTDGEVKQLEDYGEKLFEERQCGVYLRITEDLGGYSDAAAFTENTYVIEDLGYGNDHAGILFLISMGEHDYAVTVYGSAYDVFTDPAVERMIDDVTPLLSEGRWYAAFNTYYEESEELLKDYTYHEIEYPDDDYIYIDPEPEPEKKSSPNPVFLAISSLVTSLAVCLGLRSKNKTTGIRTTAEEYIVKVRVNKKLDLFTHNTVSRIHIQRQPPPSNNSGGGIQTSYHSSGFHTHSGKF